MLIGVLALQGDFEKHQQIMNKLNVNSTLVKNNEQLCKCDALIIPGGESTTFLHLIDQFHMRHMLIEFAKKKPVFATCAGSIIVAKEVIDEHRFDPLGIIDIVVNRNAFGRQIDSFIDDIDLSKDIDSVNPKFEGVFIRAPKFKALSEDIKVIATYKNEPVLIEKGNIVVGTFHPELTDDLRIHKYFVDKV